MHRFYCPASNLQSDTITITNKNEIHHLHNFLRLKKNDQIKIFNGKGLEVKGKILSTNAKGVEIQILSRAQSKRKTTSIILACAIPKKCKFEFIIEKATELGVDEIIPMETQRTEVKLRSERHDKKIHRYQTVAINAAKQSQRMTIPTIHPVTKFPAVIKYLTTTSATFIPSLSGKRASILKAFVKAQPCQRISFLIGPEGDFTPNEYRLAGKNGCIPISLGKTTLKVDTAAIATMTCASLYFNYE